MMNDVGRENVVSLWKSFFCQPSATASALYVNVRKSDGELLQRSRKKKSSACLEIRVIPFTPAPLQHIRLFKRWQRGEEFKFSYLCRTDSKVISYGNCQRLCEEWHKIVRCLSKVSAPLYFFPFLEIVCVSKFGHFFQTCWDIFQPCLYCMVVGS